MKEAISRISTTQTLEVLNVDTVFVQSFVKPLGGNHAKSEGNQGVGIFPNGCPCNTSKGVNDGVLSKWRIYIIEIVKVHAVREAKLFAENKMLQKQINELTKQVDAGKRAAEALVELAHQNHHSIAEKIWRINQVLILCREAGFLEEEK